MIARNRLVILFVVAVLAVGAGFLINSMRQTAPDQAVGVKVLPTLAADVNDVSEIHIFTAGKKPFVTLKRTEDKKDWQVMERDGYRADFPKLREFILKLSELEVLEVKTSNPASYPQIGVEDIEGETATSKRIDIVGLKTPLGLILGKSTTTSSNYVRVAGQTTSYLAKPQIFVYSEPKVWLDRSLPEFPAADVQEVRVALTDGKPAERNYTVAREVREQTDFTASKLPAGKKLSHPGAANANTDALNGLSFEDVRKPGPDEKWDNGVARAEFRMFDGTVVTLLGRTEKSTEQKEPANSFDSADKHYVRIEVSFDEAQHKRFPPKAAGAPKDDKAAQPQTAPQIVQDQKTPPAPAAPTAAEIREKAQQLNGKVSGWVFELPSYKYTAIFRPLDELTGKS